MKLQEQINRIQKIMESRLKSGKEIFFPKTLEVLYDFFKVKKNLLTKEIEFLYPDGNVVELEIDKSKSGDGYQTIIMKNVPMDFIKNNIISETDDDEMVDYDQKKIFKIYKKLDLFFSIDDDSYTIIKTDLPEPIGKVWIKYIDFKK